jgi:8-oxo-dGTP pyrophosphatase MutT (NUDIX family)
VNWPALSAARRHDASARRPFFIDGTAVGSVPHAALALLQAWPEWLDVGDDAVNLTASDPNTALATMNQALRHEGWVSGWRDEPFAIVDPESGRQLATTERAAARFWGTLTQGAHLNGYVADPAGRPVSLWVARRAATKPTDPGLLDNLVGGGVREGQSPRETLMRESWEEAGLVSDELATQPCSSVLRLLRDVPEGLQFEDLHCFDLALPPAWQPQNHDGEVAAFECLPVAVAMARAASAAMTVDAALVTLDFAWRHALLRPPDDAWADAALQALRRPVLARA